MSKNKLNFESIVCCANRNNKLFGEESTLYHFKELKPLYGDAGKADLYDKFEKTATKLVQDYLVNGLDKAFDQALSHAERSTAKGDDEMLKFSDVLEKKQGMFEDDLSAMQTKMSLLFNNDMKDYAKKDAASGILNKVFENQKEQLKDFINDQIDTLKTEAATLTASEKDINRMGRKMVGNKPFLLGDEGLEKNTVPMIGQQNKDGSLHIDYPSSKKDVEPLKDNWLMNLPGMRAPKPRPPSSSKQLEEFDKMFKVLKKMEQKEVFIRSNNDKSLALLYSAALKAGYGPGDIHMQRFNDSELGKADPKARGIDLSEGEQKYMQKKIDKVAKKYEAQGRSEMDEHLKEIDKANGVKPEENKDDKKHDGFDGPEKLQDSAKPEPEVDYSTPRPGQ